LRLYRYLDGHGVVVTKDMDEIDMLRKLGFGIHPDCPFSMERYTKPNAKVWYDFTIPVERFDEVKALAG